MTIRHKTQTALPNDPSKAISANAWNDNHEVSGGLDLPLEDVSTPPTDFVRLFGARQANRMMPAFKGPSGLDSPLQPFLGQNKVAWYNAIGNSTTINQIGMVATGFGTATAANVATTNIHTAIRRIEYAVTTAAATAVVGLRSATLQYHIGSPSTPYGGFHFVARFGPSRGAAANATRRFFAGFTSVITQPSDSNPSTWAANCIGVGADSTDDNWQIMHRLATGAMTKIDTGFAKSVPDASEMYELNIFTAPTVSGVGIRLTRLSDGVYFSAVITSNLPADNTLLTWQLWTSVGGTSSVVGLSISNVYIETDY